MDAYRFRYATLASGSAGNSSVVEVDGSFVLVDFGLGPRQLATRLRILGVTWPRIRAVVLTHTHGDHWRDPTIALLVQHNIKLYAHPKQIAELRGRSESFGTLERAGLVRPYQDGKVFEPFRNLRVAPFEVSHDSLPTYGFRFETDAAERGAVVHASDLGSWDKRVVEHCVDAGVIGIEFNHDVALEQSCSRPAVLINRVLGDLGHLSNDQAAALIAEVVKASRLTLSHLVQLHLSRECNRKDLAQASIHRAVRQPTFTIHTAEQNHPGHWLDAVPRIVRRRQVLPWMDE